MTNRILAIFAFMLASAVVTAEPEAPSKQSELLKLFHNTNELARFREDVQRANAAVRSETRTDLPAWFWEELEREVSVDDYAHWVIELYDHALSEAQARELNAIFGDAKKATMHRQMLEALGNKKGEDLVRAVQDFRRSHDAQAVDELIAFMQSDSAARYNAMLAEKSAKQKEETIKLLLEADQRVRARHK